MTRSDNLKAQERAAVKEFVMARSMDERMVPNLDDSWEQLKDWAF